MDNPASNDSMLLPLVSGANPATLPSTVAAGPRDSATSGTVHLLQSTSRGPPLAWSASKATFGPNRRSALEDGNGEPIDLNRTKAPVVDAVGTTHILPQQLPRNSLKRSMSRGRSRSRRRRGGSTAAKGGLNQSDAQVRFAPAASGRNAGRQTGPSKDLPGNDGRSWAAVATSASKGYNLSFIPPSVIDSKLVAAISEDVLDAADPKWGECLVGYLIGRKLSFRLVEAALKHVWGARLLEILTNDEGFYFFHIPDREYRQSIVDAGCFTIARVPLILQQYTPLMDLQKAKHNTVPVWVRLRNIPYSLWSAMGISAIASVVGKPLYVDSRTEKMNMISFARVCIEVQGGAKLPDSVDVQLLGEMRTIKVEYEWRPSFCPTCSTFGHRCPTPHTASPIAEDPSCSAPNAQPDDWQVVKGRKPRHSTDQPPVHSPPVNPAPVSKAPTVCSSVSEDESEQVHVDDCRNDEDVANLSMVPSSLPAVAGGDGHSILGNPPALAPSSSPVSASTDVVLATIFAARRKRGKKKEEQEPSSSSTAISNTPLRVASRKPLPRSSKNK